jgi:uncharacterized protein
VEPGSADCVGSAGSNLIPEAAVSDPNRDAFRPDGTPLMYQTWAKLLFLHWSLPVEVLRPLVPRRLQIDTYEGTAWVAVAPFTMYGIRPALLPPLPFVSRTHELNVRTYVDLDGVPGVWFFSLDAANRLAVLGARYAFHLPYFRAEMHLEEEGQTLRYRSRRTDRRGAPAEFEAEWTCGEALPELQPGTRDHFLIERYVLYAARGDALYRARIAHRPWPLCTAELHTLSSTMLEAAGIAAPAAEPLLHQQREPIEVEVWGLEPL